VASAGAGSWRGSPIGATRAPDRACGSRSRHAASDHSALPTRATSVITRVARALFGR
jgi:hypothetical protein